MTSMTPGERVPPMGWTAAALTMEPSAFCDAIGGYQRAGPRMGRERAWMGSEHIALAHLVRLSLRTGRLSLRAVRLSIRACWSCWTGRARPVQQ